jgi:hypothetical protein
MTSGGVEWVISDSGIGVVRKLWGGVKPYLPATKVLFFVEKEENFEKKIITLC